ncbi:MAG: LamG domain-containing protein [Polyangiaceae bacterium]
MLFRRLLGAALLVSSAACTPESKRWLVDDPRALHGAHTLVLGEPRLGESPLGPALCFDGDDGLIADLNPLQGLEAFTLEVLARIDAVGDPAHSEPRFVHIESAEGLRATVEARVTSTQFFVDTHLHTNSDKLTLANSASLHPVGRWNWIALSYAEGHMRHFVDAVEDGHGDVPFRPMGAGKMSLGVRQNRVHYFQGCIRELRVSPRALPAEQLQRAHGG